MTAVLTAMAPAITSVDNQWLGEVIYPLTHDLATFTGGILSAMTDTAGVITRTNLLETGVVIRREDGWKLLCGQTQVVE